LIINAEADPAESSSIEDTAAGESDWSAVDADWKPTRQGICDLLLVCGLV
jgi:hypothetical protein